MEVINVRSDNYSSIKKMRRHLNDPKNIIVIAILADWCGACQQFKPIWHSTVKKYMSNRSSSQKNKKLILATIQDSALQELNMGNVQGFPTIRVIKNKKILHEKLGGMDEFDLMNYIKQAQKRCITISPKIRNSRSQVRKGKRARRNRKTSKGKTSKSKTSKGNTRTKSKRMTRRIKRI